MQQNEIIQNSHEGLREFFDQFGPNDIYKEIFLEELFKFIFEEYYGIKIVNGEKSQ